MTRHIPVLLEEVKESLYLQNGMVIVDATLGGGSHTRMMLGEVLPTGTVVALDTDKEALIQFEKRASSDDVLKQALTEKRLILVQRNYSALAEVLAELGIDQVQGILADLGFSSDQIESADRGLSFQENGPLDMRLNQEQGMTAREIVAEYSFEALTKLFREYGDESEAKRIAEAIIARRMEAPIETTHDLATLIADAYPKRKRASSVRPGSRQGRIHPATKTFQALRIAVNQEFDHLEQFLLQAIECLSPAGRLAVISFHSGEDRRVKDCFREQARGCICPPNFPVCRCGQVPRIRLVTKKPIMAGEKECSENPRARSAKMRVIEKV
ncbi:MAG: 16S rRNA (cytosine(1402)-N(4))-methyltransferase RsmH [Candidatus Moranbacteria bacterium]|nr:16S rRNA (cytosine(1402)-N(4))-methyltransferase RsmH [Candidatus Moranbacteria bacterium]